MAVTIITGLDLAKETDLTVIWCPRHPTAALVRTELPNGKIDLRCPGCTRDRRASIHVVKGEGKK